jgi:uncharacterized membrane protein SpoIIM required for sporulation
MAEVRIKSLEFRREREASWRELEGLLERIDRRGLETLTSDEVVRLPLLYRSALSSLAVARTISLDTALLEYLHALSARAHLAVYATKQPLLATLWQFFARGFPRAVRAAARPIALAGLVLALGTVTAAVLVTQDQERFYAFVEPELAGGRGPNTPTEELRAGLYEGTDSAMEALGAFASFLFTHNARIGILAFAVGFLLGVPTLVLMFITGLMLGAFAALYHSRGLGLDLWAWMLPHGVTELSAVILCGGAGLVLAHGLVVPGVHTRIVSLGRAGRQAGLVVMGAVVMFLVAGLIEGIFRQLVQSVPIRLTVAGTSFVLLALYFTFAGRRA